MPETNPGGLEQQSKHRPQRPEFGLKKPSSFKEALRQGAKDALSIARESMVVILKQIESMRGPQRK